MKFFMAQSEYVVNEEDESELVNVRLVGQLSKAEYEELERGAQKGWEVNLAIQK